MGGVVDPGQVWRSPQPGPREIPATYIDEGIYTSVSPDYLYIQRVQIDDKYTNKWLPAPVFGCLLRQTPHEPLQTTSNTPQYHHQGSLVLQSHQHSITAETHLSHRSISSTGRLKVTNITPPTYHARQKQARRLKLAKPPSSAPNLIFSLDCVRHDQFPPPPSLFFVLTEFSRFSSHHERAKKGRGGRHKRLKLRSEMGKKRRADLCVVTICRERENVQMRDGK